MKRFATHRKSPLHRSAAVPHNAENTNPYQTDKKRLQPAKSVCYETDQKTQQTRIKALQGQPAQKTNSACVIVTETKPDKPKVNDKNQTDNRKAKANRTTYLKPKLKNQPKLHPSNTQNLHNGQYQELSECCSNLATTLKQKKAS